MTKPTINDVARIAGVSKKTVSRVINRSPLLSEATRAKVEQIIAELGYVPNPQARALALRRNFLIVLVHDNSDPQMMLHAQHGILEAIRDSEYALAIRPIDRSMPGMEEDLRRFLEQQRPAGVILVPGSSEIESIARTCEGIGCSHVRIGAAPAPGTDWQVTSDDREAAAGAIGYLVALGHRRIGLIAGPEDLVSAQQRELGYLDAMADHELDRGPALIANGDYSFASGLSAGRLLLEVSPRPTAIFAANDAMAAGVLHAACEKEIAVPDALSIVGFDDTPIASHLWPPLTTLRVPVAEMARAAALRLIQPDSNGSPPGPYRAELVPRASAAPAAA